MKNFIHVPTIITAIVALVPSTLAIPSANTHNLRDTNKGSWGPGQDGWPAGSSYAHVVLHHHNEHRWNHTLTNDRFNLTWDDELFQYAKATAQKCVWAHDMDQGSKNYGQNLFMVAGDGSGGWLNVGWVITTGWYDELNLFPASLYGQPNIPSDDLFESVGHFTQIVWRGTQSVGCVTYDCQGKGGMDHYTVCNYRPPGNAEDEYGNNVAPPQGHPPLAIRRGY